MFKASKSSLPVNIQNLFSDRDAHHKFTLRGINKLYQPQTRTAFKSMCISVRGVIFWKGLADEVKNSFNLIQFKLMFKKEYQEESKRCLQQ